MPEGHQALIVLPGPSLRYVQYEQYDCYRQILEQAEVGMERVKGHHPEDYMSCSSDVIYPEKHPAHRDELEKKQNGQSMTKPGTAESYPPWRLVPFVIDVVNNEHQAMVHSPDNKAPGCSVP